MAGLLDGIDVLGRGSRYYANPLEVGSSFDRLDSNLLAQGMASGQIPARARPAKAPVSTGTQSTPTSANPTPPQKTNKLGDLVDYLLGGPFAERRARIANENAAYQAATQASQNPPALQQGQTLREQRYGEADSLGLRRPGRESQFVSYVMNPDAWKRQNAIRQGPPGGGGNLNGYPGRVA